MVRAVQAGGACLFVLRECAWWARTRARLWGGVGVTGKGGSPFLSCGGGRQRAAVFGGGEKATEFSG